MAAVTIVRIDPPIELDTPRGRGWAHFLLDYAQHTDVVWQVFLRDSGESWFFRNRDVRHAACETWGVRVVTSSTAAAGDVAQGAGGGAGLAPTPPPGAAVDYPAGLGRPEPAPPPPPAAPRRPPPLAESPAHRRN